MVGLAVIVGVTVGLGSAAVAQAQNQPGKQGVFRLAATNTANAVSSLVGSMAQDAMLLIDNNGGGPALDLQVEPGQAPMKVDSPGKVANLNADKLDGKSETDFYAAGSKVADSAHADDATNADSATNAQNAQNASNADKLDGLDSTELKPLYKYVAANGYAGFGSSSGVTSVSKLGVGHYVVEFDRPVRDCARVASIDLGPGISSSGDPNFVRGGELTTYNHIGTSHDIGIYTRDSSGNLADRGFSIALFC